MTVSSRAELEGEPKGASDGGTGSKAAPDLSLTGTPYTHRGLTYAFGRSGPESGRIIRIADGVGWARLPVPGSLKHINIWILDDGDEVAIVDSGMKIAQAQEAWESLLEGPLKGRRISRVICTHFHPDHVGLAGWLTRRFDASLWMTRGEWLFARMLTSDVRDAPPGEAVAQWRLAGWDEDRIARETRKGWGRFAAYVSPIPVSYVRMVDGDELAIGDRTWRVVEGSGHSPEHACLMDEERKLFIAGDQVLPRITSNVSLGLSEPQGDPLGDWLRSIERLKGLDPDLLVLPSHGEPFTGLHSRLDALANGHGGRLDALHDHLAEPRRSVDCFSVLFGRRIDDDSYGLATGEAMAHLRRLEVTDRAIRETRDGVAWFSRAPSA